MLHDIVVYDACVLYPVPLRDLLMHLALMDLYHVNEFIIKLRECSNRL